MAHRKSMNIKLQPVSASANILEEFSLLLDIEIDSSICDVDAYRWKYLRTEVLSKYVSPDTDSSELRRTRAIEKWLGVELRNSRTNIRVFSGETSFRFRGKRIDSEDVLEHARQLILRVIGEEPDLAAVGNFSGGASTSLKRELGNAARKFTVQAHVTTAAWDLVWPEIYRHQAWVSANPGILDPVFVEGNILFTVPKTTVIDRVACKEPDLNMWAQKRYGDELRSSLRRFGIDLNDQSINSNLARLGSISKELGTLDLSSASDSMTTALVGRLLPPAWFCELDACRSKVTIIDGVSHENEMFSSMGNGFTFELESLIFYALARAVCTLTGTKGRVSVYGDDIICPTEVCGILSDVLGFCGFVANSKKSHYHVDDDLRESCGGHFYAGYDVKPFYIKSPLLTQVDLIHFLNSFRRWIDVEPFCHTISSLVKETWYKWARSVDRRVWGGRDPSVKTRLVTRHSPGWEYVYVTSSREKLNQELQTGLYLQTLRNTMQRTSTINSAPSILTDVLDQVRLRRRPMSYWARVLPIPTW